jgi:hypothetical protein
MDELVERLSAGEHPVELTVRPERTPQAVKAQIDRGYVHVKFTGTRGGTELGVRLDRDASSFAGADLEKGTGRARIVGDLNLNYVNVRCIADIDLATGAGTGRLQPIGESVAAASAGAASSGAAAN